MPKPKSPLGLYLKDHLPLYLFVFVLFGTGVVFGAVMVNALTLEQKQQLAQHMSYFFSTVEQGGGFNEAQSFEQALSLNLKWIVLIWLLGLSIVGLPLIFALDFLKGVLVGFTVGYMVGQYSWEGMLFALVSVVPQNLILIPAIVVSSVAASAFAIHLLKNRLIQRKGPIYPVFMRYLGTSALMALLVVGAALYEAFLSPTIMKWVTPMLLAI